MIEIISHPGKLLIKHLREVARYGALSMRSKHYNLSISAKVLEDLAFIQGAVHDIGKATKNFQIYIKTEGKTVTQPKHHALISAYLAREIARQYLAKQLISQFDKAILPYFIFTSVKRHHGNVLNFSFELETVYKKREDLEILTENFYDKKVQEILNDLLEEIGIVYSWQHFKNYMQTLDDVFEEFTDFSMEYFFDEFKSLSDTERATYFYLHQSFTSCLLFSDKTDVKLGTNKITRNSQFNYSAITEYRDRKKFNNPSKKIDKLKNKAYFEGLENLDNIFHPDQHLYSITLPTGLGKTITSLAVAMKVKKILRKKIDSRIIVTIPFTSIIDQNYEVFNEIFSNPSSDILLKHHHLAEPKYKTDREDTVLENDSEKSQFLIETWQSEIVVTTFVQLLEGIFTNRKGKLLKMPNLTNSIIILDEIQQVKYELWELIRMAFKILGEKFNCYFILMSATQPLIFNPNTEIKEIIPDYQQYFNFFNRTKIINRTATKVSLEEFNTIVCDYHSKNQRKDLLIILNTKKVTLDCFEFLKKKLKKENVNLYFLSTTLTPYERKKIITLIKNPVNKKPNIIVSTQLIEAGVDISVHTVFRALAPLDSIIQAAGRANRYYENKEASEVFLYDIEELEKISNRLYGTILMLKTKNVLANFEIVEEKDYLEIIKAYFKEINTQSHNITSKELAHLLNLEFEDLGKFSFIEYRKTESVFVQLNEDARQIWNKYLIIYRNKDLSIFEKRAEFAKIKSIFYDFVVNVPVGWNEEQIDFDSEPIMQFYLSRLDSPSINYKYDATDYTINTGYQPVKRISLNL